MNKFTIVVDCGCVTLTMVGNSNDFKALRVQKFLDFAEKYWDENYNEDMNIEVVKEEK